jgi:hypothetical protein
MQISKRQMAIGALAWSLVAVWLAFIAITAKKPVDYYRQSLLPVTLGHSVPAADKVHTIWLKGWSFNENTFRWSDGPQSTIEFKADSQYERCEAIELRIVGSHVDPLLAPLDRYTLNDVPIAPASAQMGDGWKIVNLPKKSLSLNSINRLEINHASISQPSHSDNRKLNIALRFFSLQCTSACAECLEKTVVEAKEGFFPQELAFGARRVHWSGKESSLAYALSDGQVIAATIKSPTPQTIAATVEGKVIWKKSFSTNEEVKFEYKPQLKLGIISFSAESAVNHGQDPRLLSWALLDLAIMKAKTDVH